MSLSPTDFSSARKIAVKWYYKELWDWDLDNISSQNRDRKDHSTFLKSLLIAANGDGELTEAERKWVIGRAAVSGAPDTVLQELTNYPAAEDITTVISTTSVVNKCRRATIYFAIKAAASDGEYGEGEKATVRKMAKSMDISEDVVQGLEDLCLEEAHLKQKRISLCFPDGNPF